MMEEFQRQCDLKHEHHLKLINSLTKKVEDALSLEEEIEKDHAEEIQKLSEEMKSMEAELAKLVEEEVKLLEDTSKMEEASKIDEEKFNDFKAEINEAAAVLAEVIQIREEARQIKAMKEAEAQALEQDRIQIDSIQIDSVEVQEKIEEYQMELQQHERNLESVDQELGLYSELVKKIQSKVSVDSLEDDPTFQQNYLHSSIYLELKAKIAAKMKENADLNDDAEKTDARLMKAEELAANLLIELASSDQKKTSTEKAYNDMRNNEITAKIRLKEHQDMIRMREEVLHQEIRQLNLDFVKQEDELDGLRIKQSTAVAGFNMKLKNEQQKTQKARIKHEEALRREKVLDSVMNTSFSQPSKRQKIAASSNSKKSSINQPLTPPRRSIPTPPLSSSLESVAKTPKYHQRQSMPAALPVYKIEQPKEPEGLVIDAESAFSDEESTVRTFCVFDFSLTKFPSVQPQFQHGHRRSAGRESLEVLTFISSSSPSLNSIQTFPFIAAFHEIPMLLPHIYVPATDAPHGKSIHSFKNTFTYIVLRLAHLRLIKN
jgi:hypothetical protein